MYLFLLFLCVPLIEIALFIQIGGWLGLWPTLATVFITAWIGATLVRKQGLDTLAQLNDSRQSMTRLPELLTDGAFLILAGALLLTPGFFTDAVGFILLWPAARRAIAGAVASRIELRSFSQGQTYDQTQDDVIITSYEVHSDTKH